MQNFLHTERIEPKKRLVGERVRDYDEIYEIFDKLESRAQADRCVQCGDPYCMNKCPLHNYIPQWLKSVAEKDLSLAFNLSNETSPFPEIMGRICPQDRLCEGDCTLNDGHGAITIGSIETYITEKGFSKGFELPFSKKSLNKKVAVIGSGPASLSVATYLLRAGVSVSMYERDDRAGGLLTYGIPNFKLDKSVVDRRIKTLKEAGLELYLNSEIGKDIEFSELKNKYDAIFLGIGSTKPRQAGIPNENSENVFSAMEFLKAVQRKQFGKKYNKALDVKDKNIIVIGGGDTAMDCVRTSIREKAKNVTCYYRRDENNMPGSYKEFQNSIEEGGNFEFNVTPKSVKITENNIANGMTMARTELSDFDESGRQRVEEIQDSEFDIEADIIITALGFTPEKPAFLEEINVETESWGGIKVDKFGRTSQDKIYSGGDATRGADLVVRAAYDGREVAKAILKDLLNVEYK
jgi:glutamate synthase (NADPH/NADH) small chain